jgi:hypothetical protein
MSAWDPRRLTLRDSAPRLFAAVSLLVYVAVVFFVTLHHEPWRDEADSWLLVRDCDLLTLLHRIPYTGSPGLWYLCLLPLVRLGLPFLSQGLLNAAIASAAVGWLLWKAPFSRLTRLLAAFSYFLAYEYAVIARSYGLSVLLIFIAASLYRERWERPLGYAAVLFLLFNTNAQGFVIAGTLAAELVLSSIAARRFRGRLVAATAVLAAGALLAWLQVRTPPDPSRTGTLRFDPTAFTTSIGHAFLPNVLPEAGFVVGIVLLLLLTLAIRPAGSGPLFVLWIPMAALSLLYVYVWYGGLRHAGFILLVSLLAIWLAGEELPASRRTAAAAILLNLTLACSVAMSARYAFLDIRENFSGSKEMASYIAEHDLQDVEIAAHSLTQCEAVLPYFPGKRLWYAGLGEYGSYMKWDRAYEQALDVPYPEAERRAIEHFAPAGRRWLLLFNVEMPDPALHGFRLLYQTKRPVFEKKDERYWLYAPIR